MADSTALTVVEQIPEGWLDDKRTKRRSLNVGDCSLLFKKVYGSKWRFNLLTSKIELDGVAVPGQVIELLYSDLAERGWKVSKNEAIDGARSAAYANKYSPVLEYLERVASDDSITPIDLSTFATTYLDTKDVLYDAMLKATLIGAVKRAYEPGCPFRTCLVFKGEQEIGKSSVVRNLAGPDWVCDTSQDNDKDFLQTVHSGWLYELAELDSITSKKQAGKLKNLISSPKDVFRPPYGRTTESFPRRSIFIGTSNRDDFLCDETGSSRWWVVELPHNADRGFQINHDRIRDDRDAIWKAAVLAHQAGDLPVLTTEQQAESNRRNLGYERDHPWEDFIAVWIEKVGTPKAFTTEQCFHLSGCAGSDPTSMANGMSAYGTRYFPPVPQKDAVEVGKILRRLGYVKDKHQLRQNGKKQKRMWRRVDASSASTLDQPPEAGQTPTAAGEVSDPPHVSSLFSEKEQGQEEEQLIADALLGKTPEAAEAGALGSGFDVQDTIDWDRWD